VTKTILTLAVLLTGCGSPPLPIQNIDGDLASEIARIKAIDNHAHPVRVMPRGRQDRFFDALPVDNMEPASDPLALRPGAFPKMFPQGKQGVMEAKGDAYPAWVLDQMNVDVMLADRVEMGPGIGPPRFRWVPYADALLFPLDNASLANENPDRKAFFTLEDVLFRRYLAESGLQTRPRTMAEYLDRVVTPTLERHKKGARLRRSSKPLTCVRSLSIKWSGRTPTAPTTGVPGTRSCRIISSGTWRPSAAGLAWRFTFTPWLAPEGTLAWQA